MKYHISYEKSGVYQAMIVDARSAAVAEHYLMSQKPDARICGTHEASIDDMKPGMPVLVVEEGRWKGAGFGDYRCSNCDEEVSGTPEFCPHCHSYMG